MKRGLLVGGVALSLLAVAALWGVDRIRSGPTQRHGVRTVPGLTAPVEVVWDSLGVPHVWARSEEDAFFAQGYLHARDRLWQMEMFRRILEGRLSELFGSRTVEADRFLRTLGLHRAARRGAEAMDPGVRRIAEAYARGASEAMRGWKGPLPPELLLLRVRPEPWTPTHTVGIEKIMAWDLTAYDQSLALAVAHRLLGPERYRWIAPAYPDWGPTILGDEQGPGDPGVAADGGPERGASAAEARTPAPALDGGNSRSGGARDGVGMPDARLLKAAAVPQSARPFLSAVSVARASNAWVVGGGRSASGSPLLANDMHLGLDAPNLWYLMGLHAPGLDVIGMTIPGAPGVVAGRTRGVAWGFTNAYVDDADLFVERVDPSDSTRYLAPGGSRPFEVRTEVIGVRGGSPDTLIVRSTRHGPVMTPVESRTGGELLSLQWVALEPSSTASAIFRMNRARVADELVDALALFGPPHQNVVFADTAGDFGYRMAGRVPLRASGKPPILPVPGWTGAHDWTGYLSFERHPHVTNPDAGFVVTANHRQSRDSVSELITSRWAAPHRAIRIRERISATETHDAASTHSIQLDVRSDFARRLREPAVTAFRRAGLDSAAAALDAWDLGSSTGSEEATLFYAWIEELRAGLQERLYGERGEGLLPLRTVRRLLEGEIPGSSDLATGAARRALEEAGGRAWGEVHRLVLDHPLREVPVLGDLLGFGRGPLPREGAHHTVNVSEFAGGAPPFTVRTGPSQRHVTDLAAPDGGSGFVLPGGQSGFPGSPHAWDQLEMWREGELWHLPLERSALDLRAVETLRLQPLPPGTAAR